ncbi:protein of unknown function [Aminobacter niigataensis]|nr:protein of unknown function [Aminobacter niigataensis]
MTSARDQNGSKWAFPEPRGMRGSRLRFCHAGHAALLNHLKPPMDAVPFGTPDASSLGQPACERFKNPTNKNCVGTADEKLPETATSRLVRRPGRQRG